MTTRRRPEASTKIVVAKRLGWTVAVVAFACLLSMLFPTRVPGYFIWQAYGQIGLLWGAEENAVVLEDKQLPEEWARRLEWAEVIRTFGSRHGLVPGNAYTTVNIHFIEPLQVVSASEPYALEPYTWLFPIVGRVPYKGYFRAQQAQREGEHLARRGYDVLVRPAGAYSSLGWFRDPLLPTLLDLQWGSYVNTLLHESAHATLYIRGETEFNESWASFVGDTSERLFLEAYQTELPGALAESIARERDREQYQQFLLDLADDLQNLYVGELPEPQIATEKSRILDEAMRHFQEVDWGNPRYAEIHPQRPLNNATVLAARRYGSGSEEFRAAFERCGRDLKTFVFASKALQKGKSSPWVQMKEICLTKPVLGEPGIAPSRGGAGSDGVDGALEGRRAED